MKKVFIDAVDKNVAAVIVFGKAADSKLYVDAAYTTQVEEAVAVDAFIKGTLLIMDDGVARKPVSQDENEFLTLDYASSTISATVWEAKAAE